MGWTVVISIVASLLLGIWVDSLLHTHPFGTLLFVFLGSVVALLGIYRQAMAALNAAATRRQSRHEEKPPDSDGD